ncbi:MAG TPA: hypothetical protein VD859_02430 [Nocardioides sp.]|nr:hypothetical protein [Nocardioides sp.]
MRKLVSLALLAALGVALAAACGEDESSGGRQVADSPASPVEASSADVPHKVLGIVNGVSSGPAQVTTRPTYIGDRLALLRYLGRLSSDQAAAQIQELVDGNEPADGMVEAAVVIAEGCDVPPGVAVVETPRGFEVTPWKVTAPEKQCVVATTSVAVLELPADGFPDRGTTVEAD